MADKTDEALEAAITAGSVGGEALGDLGRWVGEHNPINAVVEGAITAYGYTAPGMAASWALNKIGETETYQDAKEAVTDANAEVKEEYPRGHRFFENMWAASELLPFTKGVKTLSTAGISNTKTKLEGFYAGREFGSFLDAIREGRQASVHAMFKPQDIANNRVKGPAAGKQRAQELLHGQPNEIVGNKQATYLMGSQMKGDWDKDSLSGRSPTVVASYIDQSYVADRARNLKGLADDGAPADVVELLYDDVLAAHRRPDSLKERIFQFGADVTSPFKDKLKGGMLGIRNIRSGGSGLGYEALGYRGRGSVTMGILRGPSLDRYAKPLGKTADDLTGPEMATFINSTLPFERGGWFGLKREAGLPADTSPSKGHDLFLKASQKPLMQRTPKEAQLVAATEARINGRAGTELSKIDKARYQYLLNKKPPQVGKKRKETLVAQKKAILKDDRVGPLTAEERGKLNKINNELTGTTPQQREFMDYVEASQGAGAPSATYIPDPSDPTNPNKGRVKFRTSFVSGDTDLGGVGLGALVDIDSKNIYSVVSDQHNMMGVNPIGGKPMLNVTPVQTTGYGRKRENTEQIKQRLAPTAAGPSKAAFIRDQAAKDLEEATGLLRKRETGPEYIERVGIPKEPGETLTEYSKRTGTKQRTRDSTAGGLETRVMTEYDAPVQFQDYMKAGTNAGMLSILAGYGETDANMDD